eukprot:gnl/MRDRNA2_/MRDRNA2_81997_c0_seq1.p1 gnl/MRDRNA2_/MRDRNA2_81997_c0~~gnl/MRDRNA2_/MRDRNA2_81997_c0_seq1.p1  ORF type:complete len:463 (-),score=63.49 gnl/MRDRNA2_/MRDRNA2_81997_c0_seq1:580-1851(-)
MPDSVIADGYEALIGAIYLDGGLNVASTVIKKHWQIHLNSSSPRHDNPKSVLQVWALNRGKVLPTYGMLGSSGVGRNLEYVMEVQVEGCRPFQGKGPSKQAAEMNAAQRMLEKMNIPIDASTSSSPSDSDLDFGGWRQKKILSFLGEKGLHLVIAAMLLRKFPQEPEGALTKRFHSLTSKEMLIEICKANNANQVLRKKYRSESWLATECTAHIGDLYQKQGFDVAQAFISHHWKTHININRMSEPPKHPKTALQEWTMGNGLEKPVYKVVNISGPEHALQFTMKVSVKGFHPVHGKGSSKQTAEKHAAQLFLRINKRIAIPRRASRTGISTLRRPSQARKRKRKMPKDTMSMSPKPQNKMGKYIETSVETLGPHQDSGTPRALWLRPGVPRLALTPRLSTPPRLWLTSRFQGGSILQRQIPR